MSYRMRAGVVGCGKIGSEFSDDPLIAGIYSHAGAYAASGRTDLVGVCDSDAARAARCAERWGLKRGHTRVGAMLEEVRPEVVSVCTPNETHGAVLEEILESPHIRGVLVEKPLALRTSEAMTLLAKARDRDVRLAVNYSRRYAASHREVKELLDAGALGTLQAITGLYVRGVLHNGTHWFDLVRWLVGEVEEVRASGRDEAATEDPTLDVDLALVGGLRATLRGCQADAFSIFEMDLIGTEGRIRLSDSGHRIERFVVGGSPHYSGYRALRAAEPMSGGLADVLVNAVDDLTIAIERGREPVCSGDNGVAALRVAEAALQSAREGSTVMVAPLVGAKP